MNCARSYVTCTLPHKETTSDNGPLTVFVSGVVGLPVGATTCEEEENYRRYTAQTMSSRTLVGSALCTCLARAAASGINIR
jgi:hypothetical protein